jgi:hypothetical protein
MTAQQKLINTLESKFCPLSTDGGGEEANHFIREGACVICDKSVYGLAIQHGLA